MRPLIVLALLAGLLGMHGLLSDHHAGTSGTSGTTTTAAVDHATHAAHAPAPDDPAPAVGTATGTAVTCCVAVLVAGVRWLLRRPEDGVEHLAPPGSGPRPSPVAVAARTARPPDLADLQVLRL